MPYDSGSGDAAATKSTSSGAASKLTTALRLAQIMGAVFQGFHGFNLASKDAQEAEKQRRLQLFLSMLHSNGGGSSGQGMGNYTPTSNLRANFL